MLNTDPGAFSDQMPNTLVVGIFSLFSHNAVKTSPTRVRLSIVPDDNSGSDNYHKGVMKKVRNMVRGGTVVAISLALVGIGTGSSLTASPTSARSPAAPTQTASASSTSGLRSVTVRVDGCVDSVCAGFIPASSFGAHPESAEGDNGVVTIGLTGEGLTVDEWLTTAFQQGYERVCDPVAYFESARAGSDIYFQNEAVVTDGCESEPGLWYAYFEGGGASTWGPGTKLRNEWTPNPPLSGDPVETIER